MNKLNQAFQPVMASRSMLKESGSMGRLRLLTHVDNRWCSPSIRDSTLTVGGSLYYPHVLSVSLGKQRS